MQINPWIGAALLVFRDVAEGGRFELPIPVKVCRFSRPVHSTTLPPLQFLGSTAHKFRINKLLSDFKSFQIFFNSLLLVNGEKLGGNM